MPKIIILNGPPRCGKDTAASALTRHFGDDICKHVKFSAPLKLICQRVFNLSHEELEEYKEIPILNHTTSYRQAQIDTYNALSSVFGEAWLGHWLLGEIDQFDQPLFVASDGGRAIELQPIFEHFFSTEVLIIQIIRDGCTFENDIRSYISHPGVTVRAVLNRDLNTFKQEIIDLAEEFLGG